MKTNKRKRQGMAVRRRGLAERVGQRKAAPFGAENRTKKRERRSGFDI